MRKKKPVISNTSFVSLVLYPILALTISQFTLTNIQVSPLSFYCAVKVQSLHGDQIVYSVILFYSKMLCYICSIFWVYFKRILFAIINIIYIKWILFFIFMHYKVQMCTFEVKQYNWIHNLISIKTLYFTGQ